MKKFQELFIGNKPIIGMIHIDALPGTPKSSKSVKEIIAKALSEAKLYESNGINTVIIENMHDVPYLNRNVGPEITSAMSVIGYEIKNKCNVKCGIQILAGANKEAVAVAHTAGLDFIRAEGFVFGHLADEGYIDSDAGELLRYRSQIGAEKILVFTDIKKKHSSHSVTSDVDILDTAKAAQYFLSDGLIITGKSTGEEIDINDLKLLKDKVKIPLILGSGISDQNIERYYNLADGFIIGSYFKEDGYWENEISEKRIAALLNVIEKIK